jgi:hypothetical protein
VSLAQGAAKRLAVAPADADVDKLLKRLRGGRSASARVVFTARAGVGAATTSTRVVKLVN